MPDPDRRPGETWIDLPDAGDASLFFVGTIRTPWSEPRDCPKRGDLDGPDCRIEVDARWADALDDVERTEHLQLLYWMHRARRDLTRQRPRAADRLIGTFATRSPVRPNPIGSSRVRLMERSGTTLVVRGLDCVDRTPLIDIKPDRCPIIQAARPGD